MTTIPDFTTTELWLVRTTLKERYGYPLEIAPADADIRINPADRELTTCPVLFWQSDDDCHFVVFKIGDGRYRCQFYYQPYKQFGTGRADYDDLAECVVALLQAQADYAAELRGDLPTPRRR